MGLNVSRHFTSPEVNPFDTVDWVNVSAEIKAEDGKIVFKQDDIEAPASWSPLAVQVVASKYFRGKPGTPERESSIRALITRVVRTITAYGVEHGYFTDAKNRSAFQDELAYLLLHQYASFNSPVWFNVGVKEHPQCSACFILGAEDDMASIMDLAKAEVMLFKYGSGAGSNLSTLRSSKESLSGGGTASGPVSFMRGYDSFAGALKSGGTTRRAAKMVVLDDDHPDVLDFIRCKAEAEKQAHALIDAGWSGAFNDPAGAYAQVPFQNANHSVRLTDYFMRAVELDGDWDLLERTTWKAAGRVKARAMFREIAQAAWACGDPGVQFDTTINNWHTVPQAGRIRASNPCCFTGDTKVKTAHGDVSFEQLMEMQAKGECLPRVLGWLEEDQCHSWMPISRVWLAGHTTRLTYVVTNDGRRFKCTPEHRFLTAEGKWIEAQNLKPGCVLRGEESGDEPFVMAVTTCDLAEPVAVYDMEVTHLHNFVVLSDTAPGGVVVHNSEFLHHDDTACNLASINLLKYLDPENGFDVDGFQHTARVLIIAQEILVGMSSYPTEAITKNSLAYRPLGLGYANLGALLMASGLPYDSEEGRSYAAAITSLMTATAYSESAFLARELGAFEGFKANREDMLRVIREHRKAAHALKRSTLSHVEAIADEACDAWEHALEMGEKYGYRNSQVTVLAPTGTIGFMMDCDTTGIEPDIALVKHKKLVGGGTMKIINQTVSLALKNLGYTPEQQSAILKHLDATGNLESAPHLKPEHRPVFDTALCPSGGKRSIHWMGHLKMLAAVQPFLSGSASKTINLPPEATVEDVESAYMQGWKLGLKCVAVYRDGCKRSQPLNTGKEKSVTKSPDVDIHKAQLQTLSQTQAQIVLTAPLRRRLSDTRTSVTHKFKIGGHEGYLTVGLYEDGKPGELFVRMAKEGSTLSGLLDAFATMVSLSLQHGVPLSSICDKLAYTSYEPSGFTGSGEIGHAKSVTDYIARWLKARFLATPAVPVPATPSGFTPPSKPAEPSPAAFTSDAPPCHTCGSTMVRNGTCYKCTNCGGTSGCS